MENLLNQFKALTTEEKFAFMKEAMPHMAEIFKSDPQKMMSEMMPFCMNMMKSKGMDGDMMRNMMKNMMGQP
jgi:Glu-tRNA(Gln) amidotransferase subunit E-like FAD-binding protein